MGPRFRQKTVIVTGGTGALGSVVAHDFLSLGALVAIPATSEESLGSFHSRYGPPARNLLTAIADLTDKEQVAQFVNQVRKRYDRIDILVHAAGGYAGGKFVEGTRPEDFEGMLNINLLSAFLLVRSVIPVMKEQNFGRCIFVSALPAFRPRPRTAAYAVAKRGVTTLMETVAEEVGGTGITANAIAPGVILTDANRAAMPDADVSQWVAPELISQVILFLASNEGGCVNGSVLKCFGGIH